MAFLLEKWGKVYIDAHGVFDANNGYLFKVRFSETTFKVVLKSVLKSGSNAKTTFHQVESGQLF